MSFYHYPLSFNFRFLRKKKQHDIPSKTVSDAVTVLNENRFTELWVRLSNIHDGPPIDIAPIAKALRHNTSVMKLNLDSNHILNVTCLDIVLQTNFTITHLYLRRNSIVDISGLASGLKFNQSLTHLILSSNRIVDINCLKHAMGVLEVLDLSDNLISNVVGLGKILKAGSKLKHLSLGMNKIMDIAPLADALTVNYSLQTLVLDQNGIRAPVIVWCTARRLRSSLAQRGFEILKTIRCMRKDFECLCVVLGTSTIHGQPRRRLKGSFLDLDALVMNLMWKFLWDSAGVARHIENELRATHVQGEMACESNEESSILSILTWLLEEKCGLE